MEFKLNVELNQLSGTSIVSSHINGVDKISKLSSCVSIHIKPLASE